MNPVVSEDDLIKSTVDVLYVRYYSPHFVFRENDGRIIKADFLGSLADPNARNTFLASKKLGKSFKKCRGWVEYEKLKAITPRYRLYAINCGDIHISYQQSTRMMSLFFNKYFSHILLVVIGFILLLAYLYDKRNERMSYDSE